MKTKYFFMLMVACFLGTQVINAQEPQGKEKKQGRRRMTMEQMVDMQASKIINDLGLNDKDSAKFIDVYRKYMKEMADLRKEYMPKKPDFKPGEGKMLPNLTDAEVDKMMRNRFIQGRKMLDVREKYYDEFRKFLTPKQAQKVFDQDQMNVGKFHREM
ncbi:MAG: DUF3826 domain-containing protein, partial [Bacteroides sp.]|nr:DUF3826 domain-containing protein [Bacteroides sp.]